MYLSFYLSITQFKGFYKKKLKNIMIHDYEKSFRKQKCFVGFIDNKKTIISQK